MTAMRVLVADDHAPLRAGVAATLADNGFSVCAQAADAPGAVDAAIRERPDVCLLDVHMPGGGIRAAAEISSALPDTPILMLTVSAEDDDLIAAVRAGASGYILKDGDPERIPRALRSVLAGEGVIEGPLVTRLLDELRARGSRRRGIPGRNGAELTERESEVLDLLGEGRTTSEIAYALSISDVTVRRHVSELVKKARLRDRSELLGLLKERSET